MSLKIHEWFGFLPDDRSDIANGYRQQQICPFINSSCTKLLSRSKLIAGVCSVKPATSGPVICCPNRMYAGNHAVLLDVARDAFGPGARICHNDADRLHDGQDVVAFGKGWGKELRLPNRSGRGGYFVDWVLALINPDGSLAQFVAMELQTMDTTGSYENGMRDLYDGETVVPPSTAGINWENVNKRILPQLIYKGHVLRQEPLCTKGLYFICPSPVYHRVNMRLGQDLRPYPPQPGALTFRWYDLVAATPKGSRLELQWQGQFTTTVDQVALAFTAPKNLPDPGMYELAIRSSLGRGY